MVLKWFRTENSIIIYVHIKMKMKFINWSNKTLQQAVISNEILFWQQVITDKLQYENRTAYDRRQLTEGRAHLVNY